MDAKSTTDKLAMRKCRASGKEDVAKFQHLLPCASRQNNSWADLDTINLTLNKRRSFSMGNEHIMVNH